MMKRPVSDREKVGGADSSSNRPSPEGISLEAMKTQPNASLEPRLQRACKDLEAQLESLFARCPELWGFSVQARAMLPRQLDHRAIPDADLFITEIGIYPKLGDDLQSEIFDEITLLISDLVYEQPMAYNVLRGRTFAFGLDDLKVSTFSLAGSKRSITCALHSEAHTLSVSSTYTA